MTESLRWQLWKNSSDESSDRQFEEPRSQTNKQKEHFTEETELVQKNQTEILQLKTQQRREVTN